MRLPLQACVVVLVQLMLLTPASGADRSEFVRGQSTLELVSSSEFNETQTQEVKEWIEFIAGGLLQVYGRWPRERWRIEVQPTSGSYRDTIPWGQVTRGEPDVVLFYVLSGADSEALKRNWTGYHELAHLLIPYKGGGDRWFSEGLASYYQNILQARVGVIDERSMWEKLLAGFQRGRQQDRFNGTPLAEVSAQMHENRAFMRVYWSGAWYFFAADVQLRQQSGGKTSLDTALAALNVCCADRKMSGLEMAQALDRENRLLLFTPLYHEVAASTRLPDFEHLFASLGISIDDGRAVLQASGPGAMLRRDIANAKPL